MLDASRISELLAPFLGHHSLPPELIPQLQTYLDLLLRWNARMNLTAVRDPEQIITRHFGESLFAGRMLQESGALTSNAATTLADVGSGAGFPGIPIKLWAPQTQATLIESQHKKAAFLREVVRTLSLPDVEVFCGRAESWGKRAQVITMRAVEDFVEVLYTASEVTAPGGTLCILIGKEQTDVARRSLHHVFVEQTVKDIPNSTKRVVFMASNVRPTSRSVGFL